MSNVADARVYVDDAFVGRAADLRGHAILVAAGTRRLELRADGWFPAYRDVAVSTPRQSGKSSLCWPSSSTAC